MSKMTIGTFADTAGITAKTVLYYHKIGLLPEPERTQAGYRLYGAEDLSRLRLITHLKKQGLDLKTIDGILRNENTDRSLKEMLVELQSELYAQRNALDDRLARINRLLAEETSILPEHENSVSFEAIADVLGADAMTEYGRTTPNLLEQQRRIMDVMDGFNWGSDYRADAINIAEYFKAHPEDYQTTLDLGKRLESLINVEDKSIDVDNLARDAADFCNAKPALAEILRQPGFYGSRGRVFNEMVDSVVSPAQARFFRLFDSLIAKGTNDV